MPIRLLVCDIDGTLVRTDKSLSDANVAAVARLRDAGIAMALISARPASGMLWIADKLGLAGPFGAFNGGTLVKPNGTPEGETLCAERLEPGIAGQALGLIDQPGLIRWLFQKGRWHTTEDDARFAPRERVTTLQEPVVATDFALLMQDVDKIVAVTGDEPRLAELEREVAEALGGDANVIRSNPNYLDITAPRANKGDGIAALATAYGIPLADVAANGDQRNDMAMFARAGLAIAMGNAPPEVQAAAGHVTLSNDADGVAHAIDTLILG